MKICFVGPANSGHIVKWCKWFSQRNHEVHVISFTSGEISGAEVHQIRTKADAQGGNLGKIRYLFTGPQIKRLIDEINPDIINVHYATSYGAATALSGVKKYILSVWGSDIYDFPKKSILHRGLLKYSLKKAALLFSTSHAMAEEASQYTDKEFIITPFGVDMDLFSPSKRTRTNDEPLVVGTVKTLSDLYGIEYILRAIALIKEEYPEIAILARIAGDGPDADKYKMLVEELHIGGSVEFLGRITQEEAARVWADMDIAIIPSTRYESFGVAAVEAQASCTPVIISDVGGLMETTVPGESSIVVKKKNADAIADAILWLMKSPATRRQMAMAGRRYVVKEYELDHCFEKVERVFNQFASQMDKA